MIEIKHRDTGAVLHAVNADTLYRENLRGANLAEADLRGANLSWAILARAVLSGADLSRANLSGADLSRANLSGADLSGAYLRGANLRGANLSGADLSRAKGLAYQIPQEGELVVYKLLAGCRIAKLRVPPEARRTASIVGRKCRAEFVEVLEIFGAKFGRSAHDNHVIYKVGKIVRPDSYNDDPRVECTNGIHFFLTREEAEA